MAEKILFVDDELDQRRMVSDCLRLHGFDVTVAEKADTALEHADATHFNVIILDVNLCDLTGRDGSNLMKAMRRKRPFTPIILYTGMAIEDPEVCDMLKLGARKHVSKGETIEAFVKAVRSAAN